jgi:6-pyruvoyltetrahydropterin/6-carboxytetrahydropterin synthase
MTDPYIDYKYYSTKTYGHEEGLSAIFRQHAATHSHCSLLHGYALSFSFKFGCDRLDNKNWVVDFGGLKDLKAWLKNNFDHKHAVDKNDPALQDFLKLEEKGLTEVVVMNGVGCEKFAEQAFHFANDLVSKQTGGRCFCVSCEVREHGANSAIYEG